jgi:hypothetical protein
VAESGTREAAESGTAARTELPAALEGRPAIRFYEFCGQRGDDHYFEEYSLISRSTS